MRIWVTMLLICCVSIGNAEVTWDHCESSLPDLPKSANTADATYNFVNAGNLPIRIKYVNKSCSCTTVTQDDVLWYEPKAHGRIIMTIEAGDKQGKLTRGTDIVFVDSLGHQQAYHLSVTINVGTFYTISSHYENWSLDNDRDRSIKLSFASDNKSKIDSISSDSGVVGFRASYVFDETKREYSITITPPKDSKQYSGNLYISTTPPQPRIGQIVIMLQKQ